MLSNYGIEHALNSLALLGRIWVKQILNINVVKNTIYKSWKPKHGLTIVDAGDNPFMFRFSALENMKRVWGGGLDSYELSLVTETLNDVRKRRLKAWISQTLNFGLEFLASR